LKSFLKVSLFLFLALLISSCNKQETKPNQVSNTNKSSFSWKENITINDIPDTPLKAMLNGKEINFDYVNFEVWRGSNDNVFNFSDKKPKNKCGFIEKDNAFTLTRNGSEFSKGEFIKDSFLKNLDSYTADFHYTENDDIIKLTPGWNCALVITEMNDEIVKGKIAMCFKDDKKSWIAGSFEAVRCFN